MISPQSNMCLNVVSDSGTGRAFGVLHEIGDRSVSASSLTQALSARTRALQIESPRITQQSSAQLAADLTRVLAEKSIRQISLITFGACGALAQALALNELKSVRTIVFVDASTRAHPSRLTRIADRIERALPLGLPLRLEDRGFDAKPFLQRIRCPVLVVTSSAASVYERAEAAVLEAGLPTAWQITLSGVNESEELAAAVLEFQEVPAKCPQRRV